MNEEQEKVEEEEVQLPVVQESEKWEIIEVIDDLVTTGKSSDFLKNEYYYEFEMGKRKVRGLTAAAYATLALTEGISTEEVTVTALNGGWEADVVCIKLDTGQRAYGTAYEPFKDQYGKLDVFAKQKCLTKATRNARKQLLPATSITEAIAELSDLPNTLPPASKVEQALPSNPQTEEEVRETKMKEMFACFNDRETDLLNNHNINKFTFWAGVKVKCTLVSRTAMTVVQANMVITALRSDEFPKWILDLQFPNVKVKLYAICEERKKDLPNDIWEQFSKKTGVKLANRMTIDQTQTCYEHVCKLLGISDKNESNSEDEEVIPF